MRIGSLKKWCAAATVAALVSPAFAQQDSPVERRQSPGGDAARSASGADARTRADDQGARAGGQAGAAGRAGASGQSGAIVDDQSTLGGQTRTANFPPAQDQNRAGGQAGGQERNRAGQGQGQLDDRSLVRWISAGNEAEIKVNEFARQQAQHDQVKQFAEKMVQDHTKLGQQLQQAAAQGGSDASGAGSESGASGRSGQGGASGQGGQSGAGGRSGEGSDQASGNRRGGSAQDDDSSTAGAGRQGREGRAGGAGGMMRGGNNAFVSLHEEIKEQCAQSTIEALRQKKGHDFDHSFMHQQVVEHMAMLDTLKVAQQHASPNLKQALQQAQHHTQEHLDQAKQILAQLENQKQ